MKFLLAFVSVLLGILLGVGLVDTSRRGLTLQPAPSRWRGEATCLRLVGTPHQFEARVVVNPAIREWL